MTLGLYGAVWYYKINREMADYGRTSGHSEELGDSPLTSLLAITVGALIIVPALVSIYRTFNRVQAMQTITRAPGRINGWLGLVLLIVFSPALWGYMQTGLNSSWQAHLGRGPASEPMVEATA